jgi:SnoaL-like domain
MARSDDIQAESDARDILAIQDLLARYGLYLDDEDMASWRSLWAPDGQMHAFHRVWTGPEEIAAHIGQADPGLHMAGVPSVTLHGDQATSVQNFVFVEKDGHRLRLGHYVDDLRRVDGQWRFSVRRIVFMKSTPPS